MARAEVEAKLMAERKDPTDVLLEAQTLLNANLEDGTPDQPRRQLGKEIWERAYSDLRKKKEQRVITDQEYRDFLNSPGGFEWFFWRQLHRGSEERGIVLPTQAEAVEVLAFERQRVASEAKPETPEQRARADLAADMHVRNLSEQVQGTDLLGNSTGRASSMTSPAA